MSYEAALFSALVDQITTAAPTFSIPVDPNRVFMAGIPDQNSQWPAIAVAFPQQPYSTGNWATTGAKRNEVFIAKVHIGCELALSPGNKHLYGDNTTPGILNLVTDLKNLIENSFSVFRTATTEFVNFSISTSLFQNLDRSPPLVEAIITIAFDVRPTAGARV